MAPNRSHPVVEVGQLEFRMLGPIDVLADGVSLKVGAVGAWGLRLLRRLLVNPNEAVSSDQLIADLLGKRPSPSAMNALKHSVSILHELLGPDALTTGPAGYELRVDWTRTDIHRFERLAAAGRERLAAGDPAEAAETFRLALDLWRGDALFGFGDEDWARPEVMRLTELRLATIEDRIDAGLALGHPAVVSMVERLLVDYPRRERLRQQLILALRDAGRHAEADAAVNEGRSFFTIEAEDDTHSLRRKLRALVAYLPLSGSPTTSAKSIPEVAEDLDLVIADSPAIAHVAPQPKVELTDATVQLFDDWAFRLGRGEWCDPHTHLALAEDNADELRRMMDAHIRALARPAPTREDIERAQRWLAAGRAIGLD